MKAAKKILAMVMALMLVLSLATTAFAATTGTVKNDTNRTYKAYQIFTGTQAEGSAALGDVAWGTGINSDAFLLALKDIAGFENCNDAASVADVLKKEEDKSATAQAFANLAAKHLTNVATDIAANATATLDSGYYLLVDTSTGNAAQNPALLQVTNDASLNITDKSGAPSVDKTIKDEGEAAEGSIGDTFTFVLTATMPTTFEGYDSYKVVFHDTLSKGLTYNNDAVVSVEGFTVATSIDDDGNTIITVTNENILDNGVTAGSKITVTYTATLNSDAVVGSAGNPNTVKLEYSNDPNWNGEPSEEPTKETPEDKVVVFTFELDVTKKDGDTKATLEGAEFKLQSDATKKWAVVENGKLTGWADTEDKGSVLTSDASGLFKIIGLDQGTYYLKETKAPAGYNLLKDPITIEITATVTDKEDVQSLDALTIKVGENTEAGDISTGIVATTVENNSGATLPETGGMGTTLFYVLGGILVLAAVVLLVTKRRMNTAE